jgi:predicted enzyme related to lactoylglutathione lyase
MPKRDEAPVGAPCWVELFTSDTDRARAFYGELFGWTAEDAGPEYGGYINLSKDGIRVAGCWKNDGQAGTPDVWSVYLASADAKATVDAAQANGGAVIAAAMDVMELGTMAVVTDPGGAAVGIWQPREHKGFGVLGEPGTPAWFELHTRSYDRVVAFYRDVFGWDTHTQSDTDDFRYTTLGSGYDALAGIMDDTASFIGEGESEGWAVYFGADDTDALVAKVVELGGSVIVPPQDTPYGRLAQVADPTGTSFRLVAR